MTAPVVLVLAGGTGGHVFPALAVAQELEQNGATVSWLGTPEGLEARIVPRAGIEIDWINVSGLRRKGLIAWLLAPIRLLCALRRALSVVNRRKPDVVLGMGGFAAGPGGLAAWLLRRPLVVHEQNALAGMTNRLLAPLARKVLAAFPDSFPRHITTVHTGNPVRDDIIAIAVPAQRWLRRDGPERLLILGGSRGALSLNRCVPAAIAQLSPESRPAIRHQTGSLTFDVAREAYTRAGIDAELETFVDDMAAAYAWADLVIARAGALTVAELAAAGVGSLLVPYRHAVDDHQTLNAQRLARTGAAVLLPEKELSPARLADELSRLLPDRSGLLDMAERARALSRPQATSDIAHICLQLATGGGVV